MIRSALTADEAPKTEAAQPAPHLWAGLASLCLAMLMPSLDTSIANAGLPVLARAFGASFQATQWIVLTYLLAITSLTVGAGRLADLFGRRRVLLLGIGVFTAASFLCGIAPTLWVLLVARALQGLGAAMMLALAVALVHETVPKNRTGTAMGWLGSVSAVGTTLGPSLGGALIAAAGWRAIFWVNLPLGLLTLHLAHRHLPADRAAPAADRADFDWAGALLLMATLLAFGIATTAGSGFGAMNVALLLASALGGALFARVEAKAPAPLVRLTMFRNAVLRWGLAASVLVSAVMMTTLVVGPFYLSYALRLDAAAVGLALSLGPLLAALAGVPAGRLVDRLGAPRMVAAGLGGIALGCLALASIPLSAGLPGYLAPIALVTPSYALFQAANNSALMAWAGAERRGLVSGLLGLSRYLGLIVGASAMGAVFAFAAGAADLSTAPAAAIARGLRVSFALAAGLLLIAGLARVDGRRRCRIH